MMLRPPFDGSNPLSVASKIVEGSYDEVGAPACAVLLLVGGGGEIKEGSCDEACA